MAATIAQIMALSDSKAKETAFNGAIDAACTRADVPALQQVVSALLEESTPASVTRSGLKHLAGALDALPNEANDAVEAVAGFAVERIRPRMATLGPGVADDADFRLRYLLFRIHLGDEDFLRAGNVLGAAPIDSPHAALSDDERCLMYVKVAQAYLSADDDVAADRYVKKAGEYVSRAARWEVTAQYKTCYARILDAKRKFLEAAIRYAELSNTNTDLVDEGDLLLMLENAAKCAALAPAGPARQRFMGGLYRDERLKAIPPLTYSIFERMYLERIIPREDAAKFEASLQPHQRAMTSDGSTIFARALVEHNLAATSRVYSSVSFASVGALLGIEPGKAEKVASKMISERRLAARIDQVDGMLDFIPVAEGAGAGGAGAGQQQGQGSSAGAAPSASSSSAAAALGAWDANIKDLCMALNATVESVAKSYPQLVGDRL